MKSNRAIPPATVVPILVYPDVRVAVDWLTEVFGFVERTRIGENHRSQMSIGRDGAVIVADVGGARVAPTPGTVTQLVRVRVEDARALHAQISARIQGRGGQVLGPPEDQVFGERDFMVDDIAGHRWAFCETIADVAPEEFDCETVLPWA